MAVSSLPTSKEIEPILLQILADGKVWCWKALVDALVEHFSLTAVDLAESLSSGQSRFYHRCNWARLDLRADGFVASPQRGYWQITERGLKMKDQRANLLIGRIVTDENILMGKPSIRGTRLGVEFILDLLAHGWSEAEILENYPSLVLEDIRACFAYASAMMNAARDYPCPMELTHALLSR